jgi:hypothetical protein
MNNLMKLSLAIVFLPVVFGGCAKAQIIDLSKDEAVRHELAKNDAFKSKLDQLCIERPVELPKIIVIGAHANDRDCRLEGAFVNTVYFEESAELTQSALAAMGWEKASQNRREGIAKLWVEKGLMAFSTVLYEKGKDFVPGRGITYKGGRKPNFPEFKPPQVVSNENGDVTVTLWTSFTERERRVTYREFTFTKEGSLK